MTSSPKSKRKRTSYITGDKGINRVRLYPHPRNGTLFLDRIQSLSTDLFRRKLKP